MCVIFTASRYHALYVHLRTNNHTKPNNNRKKNKRSRSKLNVVEIVRLALNSIIVELPVDCKNTMEQNHPNHHHFILTPSIGQEMHACNSLYYICSLFCPPHASNQNTRLQCIWAGNYKQNSKRKFVWILHPRIPFNRYLHF